MQPGTGTTELVLPGARRGASRRDRAEARALDRARAAEAADGVRRPLAPGPRAADRRAARRRARRGRRSRRSRTARRTAATTSRSAAPTSSSSRPAASPIDQQPDGAPAPDPGREARLGEADHRRHAALPVRAPGPEGEAARADLRAPRRRHAPGRRRRPRADDGPARRPDPGLLLDPGRPHDRAAALLAPLPRPRPHRRRASSRSRPTPAARSRPSASPR